MKQIRDLNLLSLSFKVFLILIFLASQVKSDTRSVKTSRVGPLGEGWRPTTVLIVSQQNVSADCTIRPSAVLNGTFPGPELRFKAGQRVWIRVINNLQGESITMHFHGLSQQGSPFSDGTIQISQYGIPPNGGYFDYEFQLKDDSPGTYIYHLHSAFKVITAYGSFIIEENPKQKVPFDYDDERTIMFGDYYHATDNQIIKGLTASPIKFLGEPQALLVNGNAIGKCNVTNPYGCTETCHAHQVIVKPGKTYRLRVIGITALTYLYFAIQNHEHLKVVEVDGGYVKPASSAHIEIGSGQRYSVLLKTKSLSQLKKLGGSTEFTGRVESRWRAKKDMGSFVLKYQLSESDRKKLNSEVTDKKAQELTSSIALNKTGLDLKALEKLIPLPEAGEKWLHDVFKPHDDNQKTPRANQVTRRIFISGQQRKLDDGTVHWFLNNKSYVETKPKVPYLVRAYTTGLKPNYEAALANNGFDESLNAYPIKLGEVIEFVIINLSSTQNVSEAHPWHFHGQKFFFIAQGYGEFSDERLRKAEKRNQDKHIRRDTQIVFAGKNGKFFEGPLPSGTQAGWMVLRLRATEPGIFFAHCHLQVHALMGMAFVLIIGVENLPSLPKEYLDAYA
ncbi:multicopper oxidase-domain-containing protein [Phakopsora pachyrhizi]|nr:multicopper oxidase-domain-containing protein [Phakopsora pachyrhizi]